MAKIEFQKPAQKMKHTFSTLLILSSFTSAINAHDTYSTARPDGHAPISVMGDHVHKTGEWMVSYRYMQMSMDDMLSGEENISSTEVLMSGYTVTPESMHMGMHMLNTMYALNDSWTFMVMANYMDIEMDHRINPMALPLVAVNGGSDTFTTESSGIGDTKLSALYQFYADDNKCAHLGLGISLPIGSINPAINQEAFLM